jgi:hypothetical protein
MSDKAPIQNRVSLADMFGGYPLAYKVFAVAATVFTLFNLGSLVGSSTSYYIRWLQITQPLTDAVAAIFPAVDSATEFLEKPWSTGSYSHMVPAVRNLLSVNFAMFLFFPSCFAIAACVDLLRDPERARNNIDTVSQKLKAPIWEIILRCVICLSLFFLPFFLGYLAPTGVYYATVFGGSGLFLFIAIYFIISLVALRLRPPAVHQRGPT